MPVFRPKTFSVLSVILRAPMARTLQVYFGQESSMAFAA